ncbi:MAG: TerB family tellurite resistance protein [FCB group bacterium]|nr:TerB family tellurite resistance protein [FCB group bacterium]
MKQLEDYSLHQQLTFLYIAFAYQTDFNLSEAEMALIEKKIRGWCPHKDDSKFRNDFEEAKDWYSFILHQDPAELMPTIMSIANNLGKKLKDPKSRQQIYSELYEISTIDGEINEREEQWLAGLKRDIGLII